MATPLKPLPWKHVRGFDGFVWTVYLTTPLLHPGEVGPGVGQVGCTCFEERAAYVDATIPEPEQDEALLHEIVHIVRGPAKGTAKTRAAHEREVRATSFALYPVLRTLGLPAWGRPVGYERLRASSPPWTPQY